MEEKRQYHSGYAPPASAAGALSDRVTPRQPTQLPVPPKAIQQIVNEKILSCRNVWFATAYLLY